MIKLEASEVTKIKEFLMAKSEIYAQVKEMQHYAENFAVGIYGEQQKLQQKYNVDFTTGRYKLDLVNNQIIDTEEEEPKIIT